MIVYFSIANLHFVRDLILFAHMRSYIIPLFIPLVNFF